MTQENDQKIDLVKTLSVFNCILDRGEKLGAGHYLLSGVQARHDADGYTIVLSDQVVQLTLYFHNKYQVQCDKRSEFDAFLHKLDFIYRHHVVSAS